MSNDKSNDRLERFSALIDGELAEAEATALIAEVKRDHSLWQVVGRFYLIGDVARNNVPERWQPDFVLRVMQAVEKEPVWLLSARDPARPKKKWIMGVAIAASVCALAVFVSKLDKAPISGKVAWFGSESAQVALNPPIPPPQEQSMARQLAEGQPRSQNTASDPRLDRYLVKHNQYLDSYTVQGVAPYARVVGYQAGR